MHLRQILAVAMVGLLVVLTACGGSEGAGASDAPAGLPNAPCALLQDESVEEVMGWPSGTDVRGEAVESTAATVAPACTWTHTDDEGDADMLTLAVYSWSDMEQMRADPRTVVAKTDDDRIETLAFGDLHPSAVVRLGDDAVFVTIGDESPDRADPVDVAELLLESFAD